MPRIFLTGATGFVGSVLTPKLIEENHEVYCLIRPVSNRVPNIPREAVPVYCDLRDGLDLKKQVRDVNPEVIVHLAALTSVAYSHTHSQEVFETNLNGTVNLALAAKELHNLQKFLFSGTSEEYGNQKVFPIIEEASLYPNQPYAVSKVAADGFLNYLYLSCGFPAIVIRPFNSYGRRDNHSFVTESIIVQMLGGKEVFLGNPNPVRDLMYVDDHVEGYLKAVNSKDVCDKLGDNRAINLCTGKATKIGDLACKIADLLGFKEKINWGYVHSRPTEINVLLGDNSKAKRLLGWEPQVSLEEGLKKIISYWAGKH